MPTSFTARTEPSTSFTDRSAVTTNLGTRGVYLLTEASDFLLQESGDFIVLEHIPAITYTDRASV